MSGMFKRKSSVQSGNQKDTKGKQKAHVRKKSSKHKVSKTVPPAREIPEIEGIKNVALKKVNATLSRSITSYVTPHISQEPQTGTTTVSVEGSSCVIKNSVQFCPTNMKPDSSLTITLFSADVCTLLDFEKHHYTAQIVNENTHKVKTVPARIAINNGKYIYKLIFQNKYGEKADMKAKHVAAKFTKDDVDKARDTFEYNFSISLETTIACTLKH